MRVPLLLVAFCWCVGLFCLSAADHDELKVKRQEVFEFAEKPRLIRNEDRVEITFASKALCDATVVVEDAEGPSTGSGQARIVRHLASGVLGPKAPEPFQKDSLKQKLIWDGKDDQGKYLDNKERLTIRVSLGLKPQYERSLFWSPQKRIAGNSPILCASPEGVYMYEGAPVDQLRLFDHDGNYLRTVYPFPSSQVEKLAGVAKHTFIQDGKSLPLKQGYHQGTLLTSGTNFDPFGVINNGNEGIAANAMAVRDGRIALMFLKLNRLATDGSTGGLPLEGGKTFIPVWNTFQETYTRGRALPPRSAAFSPDGKWVYSTGFYLVTGAWGSTKRWVYAVMRSDYGTNEDAKLFAGSEKEDGFGKGENQFRFPTSVACDAQGRVYVSDYMNDRIQVFDANAKLLKSIPTVKPAQVCVHQRTGEIYAFSWLLHSHFFTSQEEINKVEPSVTRMGSFEDPKVLSRCALPLVGYRNTTGNPVYNETPPHRVELDSWSETPAIWLIPGMAGGLVLNGETFQGLIDNWEPAALKVLVEKGGKLELKRDFAKDVRESVLRSKPPILWRQRLNVNPKTGKLYVLEGDCAAMKGVNQMLELDPESGSVKRVELPLTVEDLCFDLNGLIYLRMDSLIARYDYETWREVPFDYGEDWEKAGFGGDGGEHYAHVISGLGVPGHRSFSFWHMGGMHVSSKGHLVLATCNLQHLPDKRTMGEAQFNYTSRPYQPKMYPGRFLWGEIHIFDRHGKLVLDDAFPGLGHLNGIGLDSDNNVYVMAQAPRVIDGRAYDPNLKVDASNTLIKAKLGKAKVISASDRCPVPLRNDDHPRRSMDLNGLGGPSAWVEGADWFFGGVGYGAYMGSCCCWNSRFSLDYLNRSIAPETRHYSVALLDSNGNLILRIGQYGNIDDGKPLVAAGGPPAPRAIGGDEVGLFHPCFVASHTDRRVFIADAGNARIVSVKLGYHVEERCPLKEVPDGSKSTR